ncbi:FUSC family protein [Streptomyces sp. SPB074]|uniref:FUSC family protein n=1 Tax=Streptomyces sp. (strain SPB074) TaxID=465543 RepID=UPI0001D1DFF5|nr:FUSC family protein [Streptomyces sp. SPB074]EDY44813.2 integral membrane protein [Streptomyces sp. SPB074]
MSRPVPVIPAGQAPAASPAPGPRAKKLPLAGVLRLGGLNDTWFKPATGASSAAVIPLLTLLALNRLDLAAYTMAGSLCALYGHQLPYARRARAVLWVGLGMVAGVALAMLTSAATDSVPLLITVGAALAALQKTLCESTGIGAPGPVIFAFVSSATLFAPQTLAAVPGHLALTTGAAALAWCVTMAPALPRPTGPERRATARALEAVAAFLTAPGGTSARHHARAAAVTALHTGRETLRAAGRRTPVRDGLTRLLDRAETALAAPGDADAALLVEQAARTRGTGPLPRTAGPCEPPAEEPPRVRRPRAAHPVARALAPGSPLLPVAARTFLGPLLAGLLAWGLGSDRPYWAIVTAVAVLQLNASLSWTRAIQRTVGNVVGVGAFALLAPLAHTGPAAVVALIIVLAFGAEALMPRNYWLGSVCVTPMALLIGEFGGHHGTAPLVGDRVLDTLVGAATGLVAAFLVTNRRASAVLERSLAAAEAARAEAEALLARTEASGAALAHARHRLTAALVALRAAADTASGELWQRPLPAGRVRDAERAGHRTLAATVTRQGPRAARPAPGDPAPHARSPEEDAPV